MNRHTPAASWSNSRSWCTARPWLVLHRSRCGGTR